MITKKCFVGIEAEGPLRGKKTLFIPGCVTLEEVSKLRPDLLEVKNIYYGAGESYKFDVVTFICIMRLAATMEIPLTWERSIGNHVPLLVDIIEKERTYHFIKVTLPEVIIWVNAVTNEQIQTNTDDPLFQQDKEI